MIAPSRRVPPTSDGQATPPDRDGPQFGALLSRAYARHWLDHSTSLVRTFPDILGRFSIPCVVLADVACGEGTFAIEMARTGKRVYGADRSPDMLALAGERTERHRVSVTWLRQDMRDLRLPEAVDVITCWYNSLNYLLEERDLAAAFRAMHRSLKDGGWTVFDVYTLRGLAVEWDDRAWVAVDTDDCFVASRTSYHPHTRRAEVTFTGFLREGDRYVRFDEHHHHRGYPLPDLVRLLTQEGFDRIEAFTMPGIGSPEPASRRIYVAAQKGADR